MHSPRIYWLCTHQTLRYEEVPLLIEAGAEVIPSLGDPEWLKYDCNYGNENDILYPEWRKYCTIPANIVEKIRRIELWRKRGSVTDREAELINSWIDVIFVASFPDILDNISKWFQGYIVYRVFGNGHTSYTEIMNNYNIDIDNLVSSDKYVWAPILNSLDVWEDNRIIKNKLYLNGFVSEERLGFKWKGKSSKPYISTTMSYLDSSPLYRELFESFSKELSEIPFIVLGKNPPNLTKKISDKVLGHLDDKYFYSKIAESKIFIYIGWYSNYHLHFTPVEAISMGVPVIFLQKSGLAQEARDYGISDNFLKTIGMCSSIQEMKELVLKVINDFEELERISREQSNTFGKIFSRDAALARTKDFFKQIKPYISTYRKIQYKQPSYFNIDPKDCFRRKSIEKDLPIEPGERVVFSAEEISSFTGKLIYNNQGKFISQRAEEGIDPQGWLLSSYFWKLHTGEYLFSIELNSFKNNNSHIGSFSIAVWKPQYNILSLQNITRLYKGSNIINLVVRISPENSKLPKEMRLVWNGAPTCEISSIVVEKLK